MISREWAVAMARYNAWQNANLYGAADALTDETRRVDRGAFFRSVHGTLSHILWADHVWLSRFTERSRPQTAQAESGGYVADWGDLKSQREDTDDELVRWAASLTPEDIAGEYRWFSGGEGREMAKPMALIVAHVFNHQTHHRGQVHAMLTAAGATPGATDLFVLPEGE